MTRYDSLVDMFGCRWMLLLQKWVFIHTIPICR